MEHRDSGMLALELCREIEERRLRRGFVERTRAAKGAAVGERSPSSLAPMVVARIVCTKRRQTQNSASRCQSLCCCPRSLWRRLVAIVVTSYPRSEAAALHTGGDPAVRCHGATV